MSSGWAAPDARASGSGTTFSPAEVVAPAPALRTDVLAGLLTVAICTLVGAPVGLLWARVAPHVLVVVRGERLQVLDAYGDGFIAVDGYFLGAVLLSGGIAGWAAWRLAAAHGPAVVLGLAVGGFTGACVVMAVGEMVGADGLRGLVPAGAQGSTELAVQLRSTSALAGWPVAALLTYLVLALRPSPRPDRAGPAPTPSSG